MLDLIDCEKAQITGISVTEKPKAVRISLQSQVSLPLVLMADGVDQLLVHEFRDRNIIRRVRIWTAKHAPLDYRESFVAMVTGLPEAKVDAAWLPQVERETRLIQIGWKVFAEVEPEYGARIWMLARKIALVPAAVAVAATNEAGPPPEATAEL